MLINNHLNDKKEQTRLCSYSPLIINNDDNYDSYSSNTDSCNKTPKSIKNLTELTDFEFKSINVDSTYGMHRWDISENDSNPSGIRYQDVINFDRCSTPRKGEKHHCVMCGLIGI
jgi:hypothetical protein